MILEFEAETQPSTKTVLFELSGWPEHQLLKKFVK